MGDFEDRMEQLKDWIAYRAAPFLSDLWGSVKKYILIFPVDEMQISAQNQDVQGDLYEWRDGFGGNCSKKAFF